MKVLKTDQYDKWIKHLKDRNARARINARIRRIEISGVLLGDWKSVGDKVIELRSDVGPGYRIYAHKKGDELILLLVGGNKSTQQADIAKAKELLKAWEAQYGR